MIHREERYKNLQKAVGAVCMREHVTRSVARFLFLLLRGVLRYLFVESYNSAHILKTVHRTLLRAH